MSHHRRKDHIHENAQALAELMKTARALRTSIEGVAGAASAFGSALERCARCRGVGDECADGLLSISGLMHLTGNHHGLLSNMMHKSVEMPLMEQLDAYQAMTQVHEDAYARQLREHALQLRRLEHEHHRQATASQQRDLASVRGSLHALSLVVDDMERLKADHLHIIQGLTEDAWNGVLDGCAFLARAQVDIYEGIAKKGWTGGGLDHVMTRGPDPFGPAQRASSPSDTHRDRASVTPTVTPPPEGVGLFGDAHRLVDELNGPARAPAGTPLFTILPSRSLISSAASDDAGAMRGAADTSSHLLWQSPEKASKSCGDVSSVLNDR